MTYWLLNKDHQITWWWQFGDGDFFFSTPAVVWFCIFFLFLFFSLVFSRWEQHWTLTCWNMMRTPSQLFYVWTASELEDYWVKKTILFVNALFCTFFMMHFFPVRRSLVKLWSSLTLLGCYQDQPCAFRVLQVSGLYPKCWERKRELFNLSLSVYGFWEMPLMPLSAWH